MANSFIVSLVDGRLGYLLAAVLVVGCQGAPSTGIENSNESSAWLTTALDNRKVRLAPREGQVIAQKVLHVDLGKPLGSPDEVVGLDYNQEGEDRRFFRLFFNEDVGWERACNVAGLVTPYLDSRTPVSVPLMGVNTMSTKLLGLPQPYQYYAHYRVADGAVPQAKSRYFLEVDMQ